MRLKKSTVGVSLRDQEGNSIVKSPSLCSTEEEGCYRAQHGHKHEAGENEAYVPLLWDMA